MVSSWTVCKKEWLQTLISLGPRLLVQVSLLAAFLYFFGFPAVARFSKKGVMVVETSKDTNGIPIPAITVSAMGQISGDTCFHRNASIEDCLEENTLNRSDLLKNVVLGFHNREKIELRQEFLSEDFTSVWAGRYFTLNLPLKIGPNYSKDQLFFSLHSNLTFTVFVHDPDYFLFNLNPIALPTTMRKFTTNIATGETSPAITPYHTYHFSISTPLTFIISKLQSQNDFHHFITFTTR